MRPLGPSTPNSEILVNGLLTIGNAVGPAGPSSVGVSQGSLRVLKATTVNASGVLSVTNHGGASMGTVNVDGVANVAGGSLVLENGLDPRLNIHQHGELVGDGFIDGKVDNAGLVTPVLASNCALQGRRADDHRRLQPGGDGRARSGDWRRGQLRSAYTSADRPLSTGSSKYS